MKINSQGIIIGAHPPPRISGWHCMVKQGKNGLARKFTGRNMMHKLMPLMDEGGSLMFSVHYEKSIIFWITRELEKSWSLRKDEHLFSKCYLDHTGRHNLRRKAEACLRSAWKRHGEEFKLNTKKIWTFRVHAWISWKVQLGIVSVISRETCVYTRINRMKDCRKGKGRGSGQCMTGKLEVLVGRRKSIHKEW